MTKSLTKGGFMKKLKVAGVLLLAFLMVGCATFDKHAVQVLVITAAAQDAGGHSIASLYHDKKLSEENWQTFKKYNDQFVVVHRNAVDALAKYRMTKATADRSVLEELLADVAVLSEMVSKIVAELATKAGG
jgi:hypothetical protein